MFGLSAERLLVLAAGSLAVLIFLLSAGSRRSHAWLARWLPGTPWLGLLFLIFYHLALAAPEVLGRLVYIRERLLPLLLWAAAASLVLLLHRLAVRIEPRAVFAGLRTHAVPFLITSVLLGGLTAFILISGIGLLPDRQGWDRAPVPLLTWQVQLSLAMALGAGWVLRQVPGRLAKGMDIGVTLGLWLLVATLWATQPIDRHFFVNLNPLSGQFEPNSDALRYSFRAEGLYNGYGLDPREDKIGYILFLGAIQRLTGLDYVASATLQSVLLASMAATLYWIGKVFHSRELGIFLALLAASREINAFAMNAILETTHSKLLMSEIPLSAILILLALVWMGWLRSPPHQRLGWIIWTGLLAGLASLTRLNAYLILPVVITINLLPSTGADRIQRWAREIGTFLLIVLLVVLPWNLVTAGSTGMPYSAGKFFASLSNRDFFQEAPYPDRQDSRPRVAHQQISPATILVAHIFHNQIISAFNLPIRLGIVPIKAFDLDPIWSPKVPGWDGRLDAEQTILLWINLAFIAGGIAQAWKRLGLAGLVPLALQWTYFAGTALGRTSGGRYIAPVEWITILYYGLGVLAAVFWLLSLSGIRRQIEHRANLSPPPSWPGLATAVLLGLSVPLLSLAGEFLKPSRPPYDLQTLQAQVASQGGIDPIHLQLIEGVPLYTRLGIENLPAISSAAQRQDWPPAVWLLLNSSLPQPVFLSNDTLPGNYTLPQADWLVAIGCQRRGDWDPIFEAQFLVWVNTDGEMLRIDSTTRTNKPFCPTE